MRAAGGDEGEGGPEGGGVGVAVGDRGAEHHAEHVADAELERLAIQRIFSVLTIMLPCNFLWIIISEYCSEIPIM